jgi:PelA/Pel-15E family pectate lyase
MALTLTAQAEPITLSRIGELTATNQPAWKSYFETSRSNAALDAATLQAEVTANKMTNALRAPSGGDFKLHTNTGDAWYAGDEAKKLTEAILSYQTPSGGWSKHLGFAKGPRLPGMQWTSQNEPGQPAHYLATFDNGSTTEEMYFLANVWHATKREDCKKAFIKGLNFILASQFPNGGWPQVYPLEGGYHDDITFNDDAMTHVLELLRDITRKDPEFVFLHPSRRQQAAVALARGVECVLQTQVAQAGIKAGWCAQFDALTLRPASARKLEPAALGGPESAHIVQFLMTITNPAPEVVAGIESGLQWLDAVKFTCESKTNENGKTFFAPSATGNEIRWARFYNLTNNQPVFPGRDGIVYDTFEAMAAKNKLGYDYFTSQPGSIVNNGQKKWRKMLADRARK